ncbi:MAG: oligopeptidase A [Chromatiales bacterium]|nr:oligopeptidase A [Chromatiales bacterium]
MNEILHIFDDLPTFSKLSPDEVESSMDRVLEEARAKLDALVQSPGPYGWSNLVAPIEELLDQVNRAWSPIRHLNSVRNSEALRAAYNACLPKQSAFWTELGQNEALFRAYESIAEGKEYKRLDAAQRRVIDNAMRDFRLGGVDLPADRKARFKEISQELSQLSSRFSENLLDSGQTWEKQLTDESCLRGLPESTKALAAQLAEQRGKEGWVLTLDFPIYMPVMTYADDACLRKELYQAYMTRASADGPGGAQYDNTEVMDRILALRHEMARLLSFDNYAQYSVATKMAENTDQVMEFLTDLASRAKPQAEGERDQVFAFANREFGMESLDAWDLGYYAEKLKQQRYHLSAEDLRPYFPVPAVMQGLFEIVGRLYGIRIQAVDGVDTWHPDVAFYRIVGADGEDRGGFYVDLYARAQKRGGAWMDTCLDRRRTSTGLQAPVAYLTCNFTPPVGDKPALLTHQEVITLFHEFGHGLHHMLTRVNYAGIAGIHGVEWDAVELPSQFMENWCWEKEALDLFARHYESGERMPDELYERMRSARDFQAGIQMIRQLVFSLFDFRIHLEYDPASGARIYDILREVEDEIAVIQPPEFTRFPQGFSHIFGGGYAAGYYSYKWAEVLSADAFSKFEETGIFNPDTGRDFLTNILEVGGSRDAMDSFVAFRGRKPRIDALLRHSGIAA